ncbi:MAG: tRNA (N(6)-L-threonylcarbamoyladenosine(37)-C(2))-methylthiotransferase MtaB [Clostridia bacterium]|nr:tRNA (N(6)-L-threonylcarbamoyladenosine(37)-C(2))-methylthiotransferase MtaB [Clostridia bacterium]
MNFFIYTLGCKVNQYESEFIASLLEKKGFVRKSDFNADIIIINSCTVTSTGDNKVCKYLRRARRENPDSVIALTGCMTQAFPDEDYSEADIILGNYSRKQTIEAIESFLINREKIVDIKPHMEKRGESFEEMHIEKYDERTRAFVKIEDGCNRFCSYCIIPYARGRVRSKPLDMIKREIETLSKNGYKEIVLVGINLSCYGQDLSLTLCDAVECACSVEGIERVRLGSLEPEKMDEDVIARLSKQSKLCPQFHLSLQSGSTTVLKRMNRHYTAEEYKKIVNDLRASFPNCSITTDIMTGFVGETKAEHIESMNFAKKIAFAKVHVFPYSRRKGTVADEMDGQLDNSLKNKRCIEMIEATDYSRREFLSLQVGREEKVLVERMKEDGICTGYTINYTPVKIHGSSDLCGKTVTVKITEVEDDYVLGEIID